MGRMAIAKEETHSVAIHQAIVVVSVFFFCERGLCVCVTVFMTVFVERTPKSFHPTERGAREREREADLKIDNAKKRITKRAQEGA